MGLFGPSIPSLAEPEEQHIIALCKALGVTGPVAQNNFHEALSMMERIFIRKELTPKYGDQAGVRYVRSLGNLPLPHWADTKETIQKKREVKKLEREQDH